ncbi:MAG: aminotransferase class I/II-fold pyridoxal phosphate-dependent enzyme [Clostridia bacterium]|nr:aminotransferase class I/II-fold pyridoxal phosphate-dependent enzyme [Clostridia bacterium]MBQ2318648.1 aminotransferase class I/II-fold pyridoxal phosphate-dependent enzyme [Clostridia bacterium]MBQ2388089.1 aminotransferase class I/II-fold pyridoxal phosphate-dependent enzyme [Clostridia bacterium]
MDYNKLLNRTVLETKPSGIRKFFDIAEKMNNVISLGVGEPDFATPWHIRQAGIQSLEDKKTRYTANRGIAQLRNEISKYLLKRFDLDYNPDGDILITVGGSEGIDCAVRAIVNPGDEVIIPQPSFVCYEPIVRLAGGVPVFIETVAENEFRLTADQLKKAITEKTKLLILPYPCNPTGAIMTAEDLEAIAAVLRDTDILILSDEIYCELTYGENHVSIASIDGMKERTVLIGGFSKSYSMTGWRMGYACADVEIMKQMVKIHQFAIMSAPTTSQYAAVEAIKNGDEDIARMRNQYDARRRLMVNGFNKIGLTCFEPKGAFYAFPSIKSTGLSSDEFCEQLLKRYNVAVIPGSAFGECGDGYIRASYCYSVEHIEEALRRIELFINELKG